MADAGYAAVRSRITAASHDGPVFVKDMASHARPVLNADLLAGFDSSFLVRDPRRAVASMAQFWPDLTDEEAGFGALPEDDPPEIGGTRLAGIVERAMAVTKELAPHRLLPA